MNFGDCAHSQGSLDGYCISCGKQVSTPTTPSKTDSLATLWDEADAAIASKPSAVALELSTSALKRFEDERDEIAMLWDVADQALRDPKSAPQYAGLLASGPTRLQSPALSAALKVAERQDYLSRSAPQAQTSPHTPPSESTRLVESAPRQLRLAAGLFDLGYLLLMAALITISLFWFLAPELRPVIFSPTQMPRSVQISVLSTSVVVFILISFLYPLLSGTRTTGQRLFGLETIAASGGPLDPRARVLRSLLLPLSALLLPFVPLLWRTLGFHNQLAGTIVAKSR